MVEQKLKKPLWYISLATLCCLLWSSAFPFIKLGYRYFEIDAADTFSQLLFAGCRFFLAGVWTLIITGLIAKKAPLPKKKSTARHIAVLALVQTALNYSFFYLALAHIEGSAGSVLNSAGSFLSVIAAAMFFKEEKLHFLKVLGCVLGFGGIVVLNLKNLKFGFHLNGEGFMILSACFYALSSVLIKRFSREDNPALLCGWQFLLGGLLMAIFGLAMGGKLHPTNAAAILIVLYLSAVSAVAYTLWSVLLKYNEVSKISVFGFINPVGGVILCAWLLGEELPLTVCVVSLVLVSAGIILVNLKGKRTQTAKKS